MFKIFDGIEYIATLEALDELAMDRGTFLKYLKKLGIKRKVIGSAKYITAVDLDRIFELARPTRESRSEKKVKAAIRKIDEQYTSDEYLQGYEIF